MFKTMTTADLVEKIGQEIKIIDVREGFEFESGHIDGAVNLPLGELEQRSMELGKDEEIFVICGSGKRSELACRYLDVQGFSNVTNVMPGMSGWHGEVAKG